MKASDDRVLLVVDDSPEALSMLNDSLTQAGFSVLVALDGLQALSICRKIVPDLILMDAMMPKLNGFETCKKLREDPAFSSVPVIFMTGLDSDETMLSSFKAGAVDYVQKPFRMDELLERIKAHLMKADQLRNTQQLLDSHSLCSMQVNKDGTVDWITPKALDLLEESGYSRVKLAATLPGLIRPVIESNAVKSSIELEGSMPQVIIELYERHPDGSCVLTLSKQDSGSKTHILMQEFSITSREAEVLWWVAQGKSNKELALILGISPRTVNKHLETVFEKMMVENRTAAARMALKCLNDHGIG